MARGSIKLFADIFEAQPENPKKGRSVTLHAKRNECLVDRYYFYGKLEEKQRMIILETLSTEFFLSTVTIPEVIDDNYEYLVSLKKMQPNEGYFKRKWPHLVW